MKTNEFLQTINATLYLCDKISDLKIILPYIDETRKLHDKLQQKLEYLLLDDKSYESQIEREIVKSIAIEIREITKQINIQCVFYKLPFSFVEFSNQFRNEKTFAKYYYNNVEITNLIVFTNKKRFKKQTKQEAIKQEISEIQFTEDFNVMDENGVDLNAFDKLDKFLNE